MCESHSHTHHEDYHHHGDVHGHPGYRHIDRNFSTAEQVLLETPDPQVRTMLQKMKADGHETLFDRFDRQKPHCGFGLSGVCCKNCSMGPCRITPKSPLGTCGADADLIVARNTLRAIAAACASHGARGREVMIALKKAASGQLDLPIVGEAKVRAVAKALGFYDEQSTIHEMAGKIADVLLDDLSRAMPGEHVCLKTFAPPERLKVWTELDILPISAYTEVFESLHRTTTGTDGAWENVLHQMLRTGLAFAWTSVFGSATAMDILYGPPHRAKIEVNLSALRAEYVNIAFHGHSPVMVSAIVNAAKSEKFVQRAKELGAAGIRLYGICCSGLSAQYRNGDVHPLSNAFGAEMVMATGMLDLWVADMQDVFPTVATLAECYHTRIVTTSDSCHLHGAEHLGFDHHHSNLTEILYMADEIMEKGLEAYQQRNPKRQLMELPQQRIDAEMGFTPDSVVDAMGGVQKFMDALQSGKIRGIVNLVGCNNPRVVYEKAILDVAKELLQNDMLICTNGCASFPLLKMGLCSTDFLPQCGAGLREVLGDAALPPVLHFGECLDNARFSALCRTVSDQAGVPIRELPMAFCSPEWSNEKGMGAAMSFRLLGLNSYHCIEAPIGGSDEVSRFFYSGTQAILGSIMVVECDPIQLAKRLVRDVQERRVQLGWSSR